VIRRLALSYFAVSLALWPQGVIGTFAGTEFLFPFNRTLALDAPLGHVQDVAVDSGGNVIITDRDNHIVVRVTPNGALSVIAGNGLEGYSGDGGAAINASFRGPQGVALDRDGNIYVSDIFDNRIRKISSSDGSITTLAGTGQAGFSGDGAATANQLNQPRGLAVDASGNLIVADSLNNRIRSISPSGSMTSIVSTGLNTPNSVVFDRLGNLYIATVDGVQRIAPDKTITMFTTLGGASGLAVDAQNRLFVSTSNSVIRVAPDGTSVVVAGQGGDGGPASSAVLNSPGGLALDVVSNALYIADRNNLRVRKVDALLNIGTAAGNGNYRFSGDGQKSTGAALRQPTGVVIDGQGSLFIADLANNRVRKVTTDGIINTVAGNGRTGFSGDLGLAAQAALASPSGLAVDPSGLYIADRINNRIRKVDVNAIINTIAGGGGGSNAATQTTLSFPYAVALDSTGNLYIADSFNDRILKVSPNNAVTIVAGGGSSSADNIPATAAALNNPQGVVVDGNSRIYISDTDNNKIRVVSGGTITTLAGGGSDLGENVSALSARVDSPRGLAIDQAGNLYYAEFNANRVRRITNGKVTTVAGVGGAAKFAGDGGLAVNANLGGPVGLVFDSAGNLYIADSNNNRIRKVFAAAPRIQVSPLSLSFSEPAGGIRSAPRLINLSSDDLSGLPFTAVVLNNSPWLSIFPTAGPIPASLEVSADPGSLKPDVYRDTIRISTHNASPSVTDVAVQFTVGLASQPLHSVDPQALSFAFVKGSAPKSQTLTVSNIGGGSLTFTAVADNAGAFKWLSVRPTSGTATPGNSSVLTVSADPGSLPEGTFTGTVTVNTSGGQAVVAVTMTISTVPQTIRLSQSGLTFTAVAGGGVIPPQSFSILNAGQGLMRWTVTAVGRSGAPIFLSLSPPIGSVDAASLSIPAVRVTANAANLPPGEYFNQIRVESPTALNSPQFVPVILEVLAPDQKIPGATIQPTELVFTAVSGGSPPGSQDLSLYNVNGGPLTLYRQTTTTNGLNWIQYLPTEASMDPIQPTRVVVQPNTNLLKPGVEQGVLTMQFDDGGTRKINILSIVLAPGPGTAGKSMHAAQAACTPKDLVLSLTVLGQNFVVPAGYPASLVASVVDDCTKPLLAGTVHVDFNNGDPPISLDSLKDGHWTGTWIPGQANTNVRLTLTAESAESGLKKSIELNGSTRSTRPTPKITPGGVVNAANFAARQPLSPGGMISIFGADLANGTALASNLPLGNVLAGGSVFMVSGGDLTDLPLIYASSTQVNTILPYSLKTNTDYQVFVSNGDRVSAPEQVFIQAAQPVIFQTSLGPAILDANSVLVQPSNPAHANGIIQIYAAGLGGVSSMVTPGAAPGAVTTAMPVSVMIGQILVVPDYAGLSPAFPGLYQVNVRIPTAVAASKSVPVVITVAGQSSPLVNIPVQ